MNKELITNKFSGLNLPVKISFVIPPYPFVISANELSVVHSVVNACTCLPHLPVQRIPLPQHICINEPRWDLRFAVCGWECVSEFKCALDCLAQSAHILSAIHMLCITKILSALSSDGITGTCNHIGGRFVDFLVPACV